MSFMQVVHEAETKLQPFGASEQPEVIPVVPCIIFVDDNN